MIAFRDQLPDEDLDNGEPLPSDPTPTTIAQRAAAIRRRWSKAQRERRRVSKKASDWLPPTIVVSEMSADLPLDA